MHCGASVDGKQVWTVQKDHCHRYLGEFMPRFAYVFAALVTVFLAGCGGGGGGSNGPVSSTLSFPLQAADAAMSASGYAKTYAISGSCSGSATYTVGAATGGATFEGVSGRLSATMTFTRSLSNCTPYSTTATQVSYFDTNYLPVGASMSDGRYSVFLTPPSLPTSVMVGATGVIGTITRYTDSTKSTLAGRGDYSYVIEADTANTAIVNIIEQGYDASGTLTATVQSRYRIASTGALVPISIDVQQANGLRVVYQ